MSPGNICVGAFDVDNRRSVRLLNALGQSQSENFPLHVGNVVAATYANKIGIISPHTEDVLLQDHAPCNNEHEVKRLFKQLAPIVDGSLANCFGGRLFSPEGGAMAIRRENVSDHSVCFWRADRELTISRFGGKYDYRSGNIQTSIKYVGFQDPINLIPAGSVLRLSLSRWWNMEGRERYCWLQLSGWYF